MTKSNLSKVIKEKAIALGFDSCGIARANRIKNHDEYLKRWLQKRLHAEMHYMENHFEKRIDPSVLVPGARSVIVVLLNYYPEKIQYDAEAPVVAKYAYGRDYHYVVKDKLKLLFEFIKKQNGSCNGRYFTDSAPVLERAWAVEAGLGWIGKNTNLIVPKKGSFFFIGELIVDIELKYDNRINDMCGSCTKCISSCPTNSLVTPYVLDSNRCISYQTIENKEKIPDKYIGKFKNRVFGCDICQDVCPWNKFSEPTKEKAFKPDEKFLKLSSGGWNELNEDKYKEIFGSTAVTRTKYSGMKRNIEFLKKGGK